VNFFSKDDPSLQDPPKRIHLAEERVRVLIDSVRDYAIFMLKTDGTIASWNLGAATIKGYAAEEIIGRHISTFYPPEDVAAGRPKKLLAEAARAGRVEDIGWRVRKDGTRFWADVVITATYDEDGRLSGYVKVTRDLTEQQMAHEALRRSEERLRLLVSSVRDYAIFMLDPQGCVLTWNDGAENLKGYTFDEIVGRHFSTFYPREDVEAGKCDLELRGAAEEGRFEDEGWRVRKDGSRFWANVVLSAVRDSTGTLVGFAKVTRDLTDRKQAEEERIRLTQANEAIRLRDEFLSIASHELKTPLTAVQLQIDSIIRHAGVDVQLQQRLQRAARSLRRLDGLIGTLLDVGRISTGRFTLALEQANLTATISEAAERLRDAAVRTGSDLVLELQSGIQAEIDPLRVEQVVSNLLSNALRYAAGKPVRVRLLANASEAVLEVEDRGPGIPTDKMNQIFERFERAASDSHVTGLGLGLFVTREIAVAHGGSVTVRNGDRGGAIFTVRLPLRR